MEIISCSILDDDLYFSKGAQPLWNKQPVTVFNSQVTTGIENFGSDIQQPGYVLIWRKSSPIPRLDATNLKERWQSLTCKKGCHLVSSLDDWKMFVTPTVVCFWTREKTTFNDKRGKKSQWHPLPGLLGTSSSISFQFRQLSKTESWLDDNNEFLKLVQNLADTRQLLVVFLLSNRRGHLAILFVNPNTQNTT